MGTTESQMMNAKDRPHNAHISVEHSMWIDSISVELWRGRHIPVLGDVPLAGGATAFLRPGGGTFFSGSGFLGTTGTLKILFCFIISVSQTLRQQTQQQYELC